mmetsp:Transcript_1929/g.6888  ORF Transcript_1929/g.6888 Transcript_1929/m.6888 type:complete len:209 (+) Transcript_1929:735-1361(+)
MGGGIWGWCCICWCWCWCCICSWCICICCIWSICCCWCAAAADIALVCFFLPAFIACPGTPWYGPGRLDTPPGADIFIWPPAMPERRFCFPMSFCMKSLSGMPCILSTKAFISGEMCWQDKTATISAVLRLSLRRPSTLRTRGGRSLASIPLGVHQPPRLPFALSVPTRPAPLATAGPGISAHLAELSLVQHGVCVELQKKSSRRCRE